MFEEAVKRWRSEVLAPFEKEFPKRKDEFRTPSGIRLPEIALPKALQESQQVKLGLPGQYPFTRGITPTGYRGKVWTMRQYAGYSTARRTNERYRYLLTRGQTGLSVAFDLPTQMGYDRDDDAAQGEVGGCGVSISLLDDMRVLFDGIDLGSVSTSMTINATAAILLAMYYVLAQERRAPATRLRGTVQNDILKEYIARGTYIFPPEFSLWITTEIFKFCGREIPNWNPISISGYHIREAGANAVQEVAFTLADAVQYCDKLNESGLAFDEYGPRLSFFFNAHNNLFEEVSKFRAARRLWASVAKERYGSQNPRAQMLRFHTQTAGSMLTSQQPHNNAVRVTVQGLAAVLGGTQSLHTNAYDEALGLPSEESARIALRTQQILAEESGVADVVDPLGGSYLIEELTDEIETRARDYLEKIIAMGGMLKAVELGYPQREIHEEAYRWQREVESKERIIVGVNAFAEREKQQEEEKGGYRSLFDEEVVREIEEETLQTASIKKERKMADVRSALDDVTKAAEKRDSLLSAIVIAVKAEATLGEIVAAMEKVVGRFRPTTE